LCTSFQFGFMGSTITVTRKLSVSLCVFRAPLHREIVSPSTVVGTFKAGSVELLLI
jgi:hypothetical protein